MMEVSDLQTTKDSTSTQYLRSPERVALANALFLAIMVIAVTFLLDASVFRTFYRKHIQPESYLGNFESSLKIGLDKKFTRPHRAVVVGDSQMGEGFSPRVADETGKSSGWEFLNVAVGGSSMRSWYYLIRDLDPDRSRFDVILIPLRGYPDVGSSALAANNVTDLRWMIARLRLVDIPEFVNSVVDPAGKAQALRESLFEGLVYRRDVREYLRNPRVRESDVEVFNRVIADAAYAYKGHEESLDGLWIDWKNDSFHFPVGVNPALQNSIRSESNFSDWSVREDMKVYRKKWLGKIIERYRGTKTKIVFFSNPYRPYPMPVSWAVDADGFVVEAAREAHVAFLDEHLFDDLQKPENFWDVFHMNQKGRDIFSDRLARTLIERMSGSRNP